MVKTQKRNSRRRNVRRSQKGYRDGSYIHTLTADVTITTTASTGELAVLFSDFALFTQLSQIFQYCQPMSYRIRVYPTQADTTAISGTVAFMPYNPENPYTGATPNYEVLGDIRGNVALYPGSKGDGMWCTWPYKNLGFETLYLTGLEVGLIAIKYKGASSTLPVNAQIQMTARFYRRQLFSTVAKRPDNLKDEEQKSETSVIMTKK